MVTLLDEPDGRLNLVAISTADENNVCSVLRLRNGLWDLPTARKGGKSFKKKQSDVTRIMSVMSHGANVCQLFIIT